MRHLEAPRIALLFATTLLLAGMAGAQSLPGLPGEPPAADPTPAPSPTHDAAVPAPDSPRASAPIHDRMPEHLQRYGPMDLMWWQWLALPVLVAIALGLGRILGGLTRGVLFRLTQRTATRWDERLLEKTAPALYLLWATAAAAALLSFLALPPPAERVARELLGGIATVVVFWALWRSVDVWTGFLQTTIRRGGQPLGPVPPRPASATSPRPSWRWAASSPPSPPSATP